MMTTSTKKLTVFSKQQHPFHLVDPSPWPILVAFGIAKVALNTAIYWSGYYGYFGVTAESLSSFVEFKRDLCRVWFNLATTPADIKPGLEIVYILNVLYPTLSNASIEAITPYIWWQSADLRIPLFTSSLDTIRLFFSRPISELLTTGILTLESDLDIILQHTNKISIVLFLFFVYCWFSDIVLEGTYQGRHTTAVQKGLKLGMILFILSEVMFFSSFFWAFFYVSISPNIWIGTVWPPAFVTTIDPWGLPFLNTVILLSSGISVTWAQRCIVAGLRRDAIIGLAVTVFYGVIFMYCQYVEYKSAPFSINTTVYGSTFFMITGFHGIHVCIGTIFLFVCLLRLIQYHFLRDSFLGFEFAAWYWHFVDVVWIFVFIFIYWWGS